MKPIRVTAAVVVLAVASMGIAAGSDAPNAPTTTPGRTWKKVKPAAVGLDAAALDEIAAAAEQGRSNCLVVVRDGKIAHEDYFGTSTPTSAQNIFSATKSITSTLVGIAQDDGDLDIDEPASTWITEWQGTPSESVTVRDLLSNDSGREWSGDLDYRQMTFARDRTAFAIGLGQDAPPGEVWAYNNAAIQTLQRVLEEATGEDVVTFAQERLFGPLGMTHTTMTRDRAGNAQTYQGVRSTCRDLARFGLLALNDGRWGKRQIVSTEWVEEATGASSTPLNAAYGYLWWLNRPGHIASPLVATDLEAAQNPTTSDGQIAPGAPDEVFWALGAGRQLVQVDPVSRTVVVRLGSRGMRWEEPIFGPEDASKVVTEAVVDK